MTDVKLEYQGEELLHDIAVEGGDLATDEGLATAVAISLFTDRRASGDDVEAEGDNDLRGWWGDSYSEEDGDQIGSRLWLLQREKQTRETRERAREYAKEALQWLIDDRVAESVEVSAEYDAPGMLLIQCEITRPGGDSVGFRYHYNWAAVEASRG